MGNIIFASFVSPGSGQSRAALKWLFFPTSLLFHFILLAAVIAAPLMTTGSHMPEVKVIKAWMVATMPPQPPAPPRGRSGGSGNKNKSEKKTEKPAPQKLDLKAFVIPTEIPVDIQPESIDLSGSGDEQGDPNGVIGAPIWGVSSPLFEKEANPNSPAIQLRSELQMPKLIKQVAPQYPPTALKAHIQGIVRIEAATDIYGRVIRAQVVDGPILLRGAAVQAIKQWIYEPYIFNGVPKAVTFTVAIHFTLNK
ncbi:MAG: TonB family protein [Candidatus Aminicenantes bacterium]|nr:TonB family protein [Candidatus Aminicenantes bacterium]